MAGFFEKKIKQYLYDLAENKKNCFADSVVKVFLRLLSLIYDFILRLRLKSYEYGFFRKTSFPLKVISVGNITLGGTGKTPLVSFITQYLISQGFKTVIISRGYKGFYAQGKFSADEPQMLEKSFPGVPVIINKNRVTAIKKAEKSYHSECAVLDDAFQNLKIKKSLDIVCVNALIAFGNDRLLPAGILRLPFAYLKNADIVLINHSNVSADNVNEIISKVRKFNKTALICKSSLVADDLYRFDDFAHKYIAYLKQKKVALLCAIADPCSFERIVSEIGAEIGLKFYFDDHHFFTKKELDFAFGQCLENGIEIIIITAKDEPRLKAAQYDFPIGLEVIVLTVKLKMGDDEAGFLDRLSNIFSSD